MIINGQPQIITNFALNPLENLTVTLQNRVIGSNPDKKCLEGDNLPRQILSSSNTKTSNFGQELQGTQTDQINKFAKQVLGNLS